MRKYCTGCTLNCNSICINNRPKRGGNRKGAGRPKGKTKEETKVIRIPISKLDAVKKVLTS